MIEKFLMVICISVGSFFLGWMLGTYRADKSWMEAGFIRDEDLGA
jgi:hypothetical protein